jgi:hypothetical protein
MKGKMALVAKKKVKTTELHTAIMKQLFCMWYTGRDTKTLNSVHIYKKWQVHGWGHYEMIYSRFSA